MRTLSESTLAQIVGEFSSGRAPRSLDQAVSDLVRRQPIFVSYATSYQTELGPEGVLVVLLHAAILALAIERAGGRSVLKLTPGHLDEATRDAGLATFATDHAGVTDYLKANLDDPRLPNEAARERAAYLLRVLYLAALAMV